MVPHGFQAIDLEPGKEAGFSSVSSLLWIELWRSEISGSRSSTFYCSKGIPGQVRLTVRAAGCPPLLIPFHNGVKFLAPVFCPYSLQTLVTLAPQALTPTSSH